jgi:predicted phage tail protein
VATPEQEQMRTGNGKHVPSAGAGEGDGRMIETREEKAREGARAMRSLASHFADLTREVSTLVRDETALARAEIAEDISQIKRGSTSMAIGGALAYAGILFLLGAATAALALVWPLWLAALVVGLAALIIGGVAALVGRQQTKPEKLKLERTMESGRSIGRTAREAALPGREARA